MIASKLIQLWSGSNNISHSEIEPKNMFCDWSGSLNLRGVRYIRVLLHLPQRYKHMLRIGGKKNITTARCDVKQSIPHSHFRYLCTESSLNIFAAKAFRKSTSHNSLQTFWHWKHNCCHHQNWIFNKISKGRRVLSHIAHCNKHYQNSKTTFS